MEFPSQLFLDLCVHPQANFLSRFTLSSFLGDHKPYTVFKRTGKMSVVLKIILSQYIYDCTFQLINSFVHERPNTKKFSSIYQHDSVLEVCVYVCM